MALAGTSTPHKIPGFRAGDLANPGIGAHMFRGPRRSITTQREVVIELLDRDTEA